MTDPPRDPFRAFVALQLPGRAKRALVDAEARMKQACPSRLRPRWTLEAQLHVTLHFLGDVPRADLPTFERMLAEHAAATAPIRTRLDTVVAFGRPRKARTLVAAVADPDGAIEALASRLQDAAAVHGIPRENRAFRPHVTLARLKRPGNAEAVLEAAGLEPTPLTLDEVRLYESVVTREGGRYTALASAKLGAT